MSYWAVVDDSGEMINGLAADTEYELEDKLEEYFDNVDVDPYSLDGARVVEIVPKKWINIRFAYSLENM